MMKNNASDCPTIFVDADACPVKDEIIKVANRYGILVKMVANQGMRPSRDPLVEHVLVGAAFDAADDWIANHATAGDICVTNDVLLAERLVNQGVKTTNPAGRLFSDQTIGMARGLRDLNQYLREAGEIKGYNRPFSRQDRSNFLQVLDQLVQTINQGK